jgi:hypothetical protein
MTAKKNKQAINFKNLSKKQLAAIAAVLVGIVLLILPAKPFIKDAGADKAEDSTEQSAPADAGSSK